MLCDGITDYVPLPAFPAANYQQVETENGKTKLTTKAWPTKNQEINKLLPNISSEIGIEERGGGLSVGPFVKAEGLKRRITIDFMKYRSEPVTDKDNKTLFYSRIGAGLRLTLNIVTTDATLGTGSLIGIAVSASAGKTHGEIKADVIGMDSSDITLAMPFTSDVSAGSIQSIIEAMAVIKAKLHDEKTSLDPQFIARIDCIRGQSARH